MCCPRLDTSWVAMHPPLPKESLSLPYAWPLVPHRETLEDWPWRNRNAEGAFWSYFSLVHWTLTCPFTRLFLTHWDAMEVLFIQTISLLEAPLLLFSDAGRYQLKWDPRGPPLVLFSGIPLHPVLFGWYKATIFHPQKTTQILLWYITLTSNRTTVCHHWCTYKNIISLLFQLNTSIQSILTKALQISDCMWAGVYTENWKMCYRKHNVWTTW